MPIPATRVNWAGPAQPGSPINPVVIMTTPLVAAQLQLLSQSPEFQEAAAEHPKAYAGVVELLTAIHACMEAPGRAAAIPAPKQVAEEGLHVLGMDSAYPGDSTVFRFPPGTPPVLAQKMVDDLMRRPAELLPPEIQTPGPETSAPGTGIHAAIESYHNPVKFRPGRVPLSSILSRGDLLKGGEAVND